MIFVTGIWDKDGNNVVHAVKIKRVLLKIDFNCGVYHPETSEISIKSFGPVGLIVVNCIFKKAKLL